MTKITRPLVITDKNIPTDITIAQSIKPLPIVDIAESVDILPR